MRLNQYVSIAEKEGTFRYHVGNRHYDRIVTPNEFDDWYAEMIQLKDRIYRGVNEAKYKNYTSAQRLFITRELLNYGVEDVIEEQINNLRSANNHLLERYCAALGVPCSDLFIMSMAQHHKESISPLLDFSTDVNTALYFMQKGAEFVANGVGIGDGNSVENYMSIYSAPISYFDSLDKTLAFKDWAMNEFFPEEDASKDVEPEEINMHVLHELSFENLNDSGFTYYIPLNAEIPYKNKMVGLISCNLNMVAQDGCFIFHDKGISPLEDNLTCVDIHKSLIPYIMKKCLLPNGKTDEAMFPVVDQITSASLFDALANLRTKD